jgi:hypothetical protein
MKDFAKANVPAFGRNIGALYDRAIENQEEVHATFRRPQVKRGRRQNRITIAPVPTTGA